jgi:hypothetical protein
MAFHKDVSGAVWVDSAYGDELVCIVDPNFIAEHDVDSIGDPFKRSYVERVWGPLVKVQPTGWEEV